MSDKPILFSAPMVKALLAGTKTQTRRIIKPQPTINEAGLLVYRTPKVSAQGKPETIAMCLRIGAGDRLWVKETWRPFSLLPPREWDIELEYSADSERRIIEDGEFGDGDWLMPKAAARGNVSPLFMPRWASRFTLHVTNVRVERLKSISDEDALAEGIIQHGRFYGLADGDWDDAELAAIAAYSVLWERINGAGSWDANPWVAAYTFAVESCNIANARIG